MNTSTHNARIELALADLGQQEKPNYRGTAKKHGLVESTLRRRWKGQSLSKQAAASQYRQCLTFPQEEALVQQINRLTDRGMPPTSGMVRNLAEEVIGRPVGKNWTGDFVKRYKSRLTSVYLRNIDSQRIKSEYAPLFKQFYDLLINGIEKYNITAENIYNWDEKGFVIGQASATKRIMSKEALESGRITHASQDGSREFISLLACISADGVALPPSLIYKGDSGTLQDTWMEDFGSEDEAHFAVSSNGWSCNGLGLYWLKNIFQRYTSQKAGNRRRLLIVDGHSSHVNMEFINLCDKLRIILMILPPHSTHRLQPLDVSLFAPLATFYTNGLNALMFNSLGMVSMSKRSFWSLFLPAWKQAFTPKNIASGFEKTGIWPCNPSLVLTTITKPQSIEPEKDSQLLKTPMTSRAIRRIQKAYEKSPVKSMLALIFHANERLAAQHSIDEHVRKGLVEALRHEKKKRQRGKRLNLLGEEDSGPQFFSPARVQAARDWQTVKDTNEALRQQGIVDKKSLMAAKKKQKELDKIERAQLLAERRQQAAEIKAQKTIEKQAQVKLKEVENKQNKGLLKSAGPQKVQKSRKKQVRRSSNTIIAQQVDEVILTTLRGRRLQRPQRFDL